TNVVPKEGSNRYSGYMYTTYGNQPLESNNITPTLAGQGLTTSGFKRQWDFNPALGGPIVNDKLWFYGSCWNVRKDQLISGAYYNLTPTNPVFATFGSDSRLLPRWVYTPDSNSPAHSQVTDANHTLRLTWQATTKNKLSMFYDIEPHRIYNRNLTGT